LQEVLASFVRHSSMMSALVPNSNVEHDIVFAGGMLFSASLAATVSDYFAR
jgi:hypothetical protein